MRERPQGHRDAGHEDDEGARRGQQSGHAPAPVEAGEDALGEDGDEAHAGDRAGEADAEGEDEQHPERDAVERDRGEQHDERRRAGQQAARDPDRDQAAAVVLVAMVVVVPVRVGASMARAACEHGRADADDEQPGAQVDPRIELLRDDPLRQQQRHAAEREHAGGVSGGRDQAEEGGVPRRAARADQVGADDRLPVARRERVRRAQKTASASDVSTTSRPRSPRSTSAA